MNVSGEWDVDVAYEVGSARHRLFLVVDGNHVTLWATTSTSSASGDNGADPNKVVEITDRIDATTTTGEVANESFRVIVGPTYGKVYRGVAHID